LVFFLLSACYVVACESLRRCLHKLWSAYVNRKAYLLVSCMRESQGGPTGSAGRAGLLGMPAGEGSTHVLVCYWPSQARPAGRLARIWHPRALPPRTTADQLHLRYQAFRSDRVLSRLRNDLRVTAAEAPGRCSGRPRLALTSVSHPVLPGLASAAGCSGWSQGLMSWVVTRHGAAVQERPSILYAIRAFFRPHTSFHLVFLCCL
jgi:hypothetical protein